MAIRSGRAISSASTVAKTTPTTSPTILGIMAPTSDNLMDEVGRVRGGVPAEVIGPRFEALRHGDVRFKSPGEIVTVADEESERLLTLRLGQLVPGAVMVGEEQFSSGPGLADALDRQQVWLVDPLD